MDDCRGDIGVVALWEACHVLNTCERLARRRRVAGWSLRPSSLAPSVSQRTVWTSGGGEFSTRNYSAPRPRRPTFVPW